MKFLLFGISKHSTLIINFTLHDIFRCIEGLCQLEISLLIFYRLSHKTLFRTINFRQFRKKYALPNDRVFSFANLYIKCIFVNIFNHFLQQGSMPAYIDMTIRFKVCGAEVSCYYSLECIEYLKKKIIIREIVQRVIAPCYNSYYLSNSP